MKVGVLQKHETSIADQLGDFIQSKKFKVKMVALNYWLRFIP